MTIVTETDVMPRAVPGEIPNGVFTVIGPKGHRTVKVTTVDHGALEGRRIVYVMTGPDNMWNYTGVAFLNTIQEEYEEEYTEATVDEQGVVSHETKKRTATRPKDVLQVWQKKRGSELHKVVQAWFRILTTGIDGYRYEVAKNCIRCNRLLTSPESIEAGIGPICATGGTD